MSNWACVDQLPIHIDTPPDRAPNCGSTSDGSQPTWAVLAEDYQDALPAPPKLASAAKPTPQTTRRRYVARAFPQEYETDFTKPVQYARVYSSEKIDQTITRDMYLKWRSRQGCTENPTDVTNPFYVAMIKCAFRTDPHRRRAASAVPGRTLVGARHETIHCWRARGLYPRDVFPPTDAHSATIIGDKVWIIGSVGYICARGRKAQVPVLDLTTMRMSGQTLTGDDAAGKCTLYTDKLRWVRNTDENVVPERTSMVEASRRGLSAILDFRKTSGKPCVYSDEAMDEASMNGFVSPNGRVRVLDWWKTSGLTCKWTWLAMDKASENGHVET
ncbi:hypothetical protein PhCBS80983_g03260 [Powellomyces hirtus]|uniref:Uncharacterized protein n=1 Tax=Powellomyces hirtus TaxID=109895 RepID=A0A507E4B0_9FUNG|nr:hypothetical protein PhCBS80983_g03260 [Powellomyces hirtus]